MERMWRKVNHSFGSRTSKSSTAASMGATTAAGTAPAAVGAGAGALSSAGGTATMQSTDTVSSAGGFGDGQVVVAVAGLPSSTATGRRLAASGAAAGGGALQLPPPTKSLSQHVLQNSTASSERRRRRRRKSRPRRSGGGGGMTSCVGGGGGDNMSSSGGFYTIKEYSNVGGSSNHRHHHKSQGGGGGGGGGGAATASSRLMLMASSAPPSGTIMMYPNAGSGSAAHIGVGTLASGLPLPPPPPPLAATASSSSANSNSQTGGGGGIGGGGGGGLTAAPDISLRQRAVAKLRMFNFHLNWDLHMTHCKPCGPRIGSGSGGGGGGNIITRRLCRNRRREDNELYRSNSFKFERFERKECIEDLTDTLQKQIAICDDYSLPVDFVKKRPSSFDPNLAESIPANPEHWAAAAVAAPSPQAEFVAFADAQQQQQQQQLQGPPPPPLPPSVAAAAAPPPPPLPPQAIQQQPLQPPPPSQTHHNSNVATTGPLSTLPSALHASHQQQQQQQQHGFTVGSAAGIAANSTLPPLQQHQFQPQQQQHSIQLKTQQHRNQQQQLQLLQRPVPLLPQQHQQQQAAHPPLPQTSIKQASIKLIEGYSDPKDSKHQQRHQQQLLEHYSFHHHHHQQQQQQQHHHHHHHQQLLQQHHQHQQHHQQLQRQQQQQQQHQRHHKKVFHKKGRRRTHKQQQQQKQQQQSQYTQQSLQQQQDIQLPQQQQQQQQQLDLIQQKATTAVSNQNGNSNNRDKRSNYSSDSSAPRSSDDEEDEAGAVAEQEDNDEDDVEEVAGVELARKVPELNSPDSISDDLVRPLPPHLHRSPRKLAAAESGTVAGSSSKRNPSPYYYSDLLKSKEQQKDPTKPAGATTAATATTVPTTNNNNNNNNNNTSNNTAATEAQFASREARNKSRQSTVSEPPLPLSSQQSLVGAATGAYRKSNSLDVPPQQQQQAASTELELAEEANEFAFEVREADDYANNAAALGLAGSLFDDGSVTAGDVAADAAAAAGGKRYSFTEGGVHIIRCDSPSSTTSEESDCSECQKRREWHARALALVRKTCNVKPVTYAAGAGEEVAGNSVCHEQRHDCADQAAATSMPPHRLCGPAAVCACIAPPSNGTATTSAAFEAAADELDDYFRPRSIFYVHPHGVHQCVDCCTPPPSLNNKPKSKPQQRITEHVNRDEADDGPGYNDDDDEDEDDIDGMSGRTRQIYETAFDCKVAKSDDDLDEVERISNHPLLLQLAAVANNNNNNNSNNSNNSSSGTHSNHQQHNGNTSAAITGKERLSKASATSKSRLEGKRLKNSKNQAIQEQAGGNSGAGTPLSVAVAATVSGAIDYKHTGEQDHVGDGVSALSAELQLLQVDQQNNATATTANTTTAAGAVSSSQLPLRGYTPSPPSTAPLPIKFPGKHDRFFMNSIRSAPNLPSTNPAHPRLRDLRLPVVQTSLRQQLQQQGSSLGTSNENSLTDSAYVNPPSSSLGPPLNHHHPHQSTIGGVGGGGSTTTGSGGSKMRDRPRSFVLESGRVLELRRAHHHHQHHHHHHSTRGGGSGQHNYSSTESIATSSSGGSMESLRSSTSEGNRSTTSSESRHSTSLSSHSSESGSSSVAASYPLRAPAVVHHAKLHILSPISDKSSQEPPSTTTEQPLDTSTTASKVATPDGAAAPQQLGALSQQQSQHHQSHIEALKKRRSAAPQNKTLLQLAADEMLGSDSGISLHSREDAKPLEHLQKFTLPKLNFPATDKGGGEPSISANTTVGVGVAGALPQDLRDLPFDMPKLRRRKPQQDACTSGSATSVDLGDLPFDMPKLRRRLRANQAEINNLIIHSTESSGISQASSSHSMRDDSAAKTALKLDSAIFRQNLTLNLNEPRNMASNTKFGSLDLRGAATSASTGTNAVGSTNKELNLNLAQGYATAVDLIDVSIPLERQGWYHGAITRIDAETTLRPLAEGSFLVRNCESTKQDYSLSLKGAKGFMHMRIQRNDAGQYILGQFSRPFETVPDMIRHFCLNRLPVRGAEHMCLIEPVIAQLL